jgi:FkbM family methyltransferase
MTNQIEIKNYPNGNREAFPGDYLRFNYPFNENSIVIDLGAHHGWFSNEIYDRYKCYIHAFEPVEHNYKICEKELQGLEKVFLYKTGLSSKNDLCDFHVAGESSSIYIGTVLGEFGVRMTKIDDFLNEKNIKKVDLLKMNIEGSEYELMEYIIDLGIIEMFDNIQIQFHEDAFEGWRERYDRIVENLKKTHHYTYHYEFKFENWRKNNLN